MVALTSLKAYISIFIINTTNNRFELYTDTFDEFSFTELKHDLEEILDISNFTSEHLHDDKIGPRITSTYKKLETENRQTDGLLHVIIGLCSISFSRF